MRTKLVGAERSVLHLLTGCRDILTTSRPRITQILKLLSTGYLVELDLE